MVKNMVQNATAKKRGGPAPKVPINRSCILARLAEPRHRPMRPLIGIARIYMAAIEGNLPQLATAKLPDKRPLTLLLRKTLNGDGGICRDLLGELPNSNSTLQAKTLGEIELLLNDAKTPLELVMDKKDAAQLRAALRGVAKSLKSELEQEERARYLNWISGGEHPPTYPESHSCDDLSQALQDMGRGGNETSESLVVGHGV